MIAHTPAGFDSFVVKHNLPQRQGDVKLIKNGVGVVSLEIFNGYVDKKETPQYAHLRCGRVHIDKILKKMGESFKLQPSLLEQETEHDEIS